MPPSFGKRISSTSRSNTEIWGGLRSVIRPPHQSPCACRALACRPGPGLFLADLESLRLPDLKTVTATDKGALVSDTRPFEKVHGNGDPPIAIYGQLDRIAHQRV